LDKKGDFISEVVCVKKDHGLMKLEHQKEFLKEELARHTQHHVQDPDGETSGFCGGRKKHSAHVAEHTQQLKDLEADIKKERENMQKIDDDDSFNPIYSDCGFVTFVHRRDAEIALKLTYREDEDEFACEIPPDPADVIYKDFMVDETAEAASESFGLMLVGLLFMGYMPIIVGISSVASLETLREHVQLFAHIIDNYPSLAAMWDGLVGALALTLMVGFIPTFLVIIFSTCYALRAEAWLQHKVQIYYYYFNVIFVLLVTAVGSSLLEKVEELIKSPTSVFKLLAMTMPTASHFYLNLFPTTWGTHALVLTRYIQLSKWSLWNKIFDNVETVRDKTEPEDQDYYGMGSRSARFAIMLVIAITFCTLSPLILVLGIVNSGICRVFYGYLFNYAEVVKADLGGVFFVSQLRHILQGMFIYIVLMSGVLFYRGTDEKGNGPGIYPGVIAGLSMLWMIPTYTKFDKKFHWVDLPFSEITKDNAKGNHKRAPRRCSYQQPELMQ